MYADSCLSVQLCADNAVIFLVTCHFLFFPFLYSSFISLCLFKSIFYCIITCWSRPLNSNNNNNAKPILKSKASDMFSSASLSLTNTRTSCMHPRFQKLIIKHLRSKQELMIKNNILLVCHYTCVHAHAWYTCTC